MYNPLIIKQRKEVYVYVYSLLMLYLFYVVVYYQHTKQQICIDNHRSDFDCKCVGVLHNNKTNLAFLHQLRTLGSRLDYCARRQSYAIVKL